VWEKVKLLKFFKTCQRKYVCYQRRSWPRWSSVMDPFWFQCRSGSSILGQCGSGSGSRGLKPGTVEFYSINNIALKRELHKLCMFFVSIRLMRSCVRNAYSGYDANKLKNSKIRQDSESQHCSRVEQYRSTFHWQISWQKTHKIWIHSTAWDSKNNF
jgi:hypothetical protein